MLTWIIIILIIVGVVGAIKRKNKREDFRAAREGTEFVPDDSNWAANITQFGRHDEYPIVGNDPDEYFGRLINSEGKHINWRELSGYKNQSANFEYEELIITPYLIDVDGVPDGRMFFHIANVPNSKNTPQGYSFCDANDDNQNGEKNKSMKFCPYCGFELKPGNKFCPKCGKEL